MLWNCECHFGVDSTTLRDSQVTNISFGLWLTYWRHQPNDHLQCMRMTGHFSQRTKTSSGGSNGLKSHWQIKQNDSFLVFLLQQVHIKFYHSHQNNNKEQRNILKATYYKLYRLLWFNKNNNNNVIHWKQ